MMWKDFFYFTKSERRGIIVLLLLVVAVFSIPAILSSWKETTPVPSNGSDEFEKEYLDFIASVREMDSGKDSLKKKWSTTYPRQEVRLAFFDPNTADSLTFLSLGLPSWMAGNILRYRSKQGRFRQPDDFRKIYGLTEEQFQTLRPYIRIAEVPRPEVVDVDTTSLLTVSFARRDTVFKYPSGTLVSLNEADTTELKKIPGIGSAIARMIVSYRKRLGAFHRIEQLQDIHLKVEPLRSWFRIDTTLISRININRAGVERMMRHPYINYYQARTIVEHRKKKGELKTLRQLALYEEFTPADLERMAPYICFE